MIDTILTRRPICEVCWSRPATQLHHCLVHRMKGHPELTCEENLQPICERCHTSGEQRANSMENRIAFANIQIERGFKIGEWYRSLPLKVKEHWLEVL